MLTPEKKELEKVARLYRKHPELHEKIMLMLRRPVEEWPEDLKQEAHITTNREG